MNTIIEAASNYTNMYEAKFITIDELKLRLKTLHDTAMMLADTDALKGINELAQKHSIDLDAYVLTLK